MKCFYIVVHFKGTTRVRNVYNLALCEFIAYVKETFTAVAVPNCKLLTGETQVVFYFEGHI